MATPTSSSNRSKRKGTKPITQGQNPQRSNRQKVSNAKVTNSSKRGGNSGSAKVTTGRGASTPKLADPWKAPTPKNSRTSAPKGNTTFRTQNTGITLPNSRRAGVNLPKTGARAERTASRVNQLSRAAQSATKAATKAAPKAAGMAGRVAGAFGTALAIPAAIKNIKDVAERNKRWEAYKERMGMNQKPSTNEARSNTRSQRAKPPTVSLPKPVVRDRQGRRVTTTASKSQGTNWRDKVSSSNVDQLRQGQNATTRSYADKTPAKPPTPPRRNPAPTADQRRSGGGGGTRTQTSSSTSSQRPSPYRTNDRGFYRGSDDYEKRLSENNQKKYGDSSTSGNPLLDKMRRDMGRNVKTGERKATTTTAKTSSTTGPAKPAQPAAPNTKKDSKSATAAFENNRKSLESDTKATKVNTSKVERKSDSKNSTPNSLRDAISDRKKKRQNTVAARVAQLRNGRMA